MTTRLLSGVAPKWLQRFTPRNASLIEADVWKKDRPHAWSGVLLQKTVQPRSVTSENGTEQLIPTGRLIASALPLGIDQKYYSVTMK